MAFFTRISLVLYVECLVNESTVSREGNLVGGRTKPVNPYGINAQAIIRLFVQLQSRSRPLYRGK